MVQHFAAQQWWHSRAAHSLHHPATPNPNPCPGFRTVQAKGESASYGRRTAAQQKEQALWHVLLSLAATICYFVLMPTKTFTAVLVEGSHAITDESVSMGVLEDSQ